MLTVRWLLSLIIKHVPAVVVGYRTGALRGFLWLLVAEGGADGGAEFGVLGYVEAHFVEVLNHLEDGAALRYLGKVAYWHNVLDAAVEGA